MTRTPRAGAFLGRGYKPQGYGWSVLEVGLHPKNPTTGSEDGIHADSECIAVFDGVSSTDPHLRMGTFTPAQYAVQRSGIPALARLAECVDDPIELVRGLSAHLAGALKELSVEGRPSYVFVAYLPRLNCIVRVGDCHYLIDGIGNNPDLQIDRVKAFIRQRMLRKLIRGGAKVEDLVASDPTWPRMLEITNRRQPAFANNAEHPYGYGVVNGGEVPVNRIEVIPVPGDARSIVLASDGYPEPALAPTLAETEENFMRLMREDPLGFEKWLSVRGVNPAINCFDDRTYVRVVR